MKQLLCNALKALAIITSVLIVIFLMLAPPRFVLLKVSDTNNMTAKEIAVKVDRLIDLGGNPVSIGKYYFFIIPGSSELRIWSQHYEAAEVVINSSAEIFRGNVIHYNLSPFLHWVNIKLAEKEPLKMISYRGKLTHGIDQAPQILPIHPKFRGYYTRLDWLRRQYSLKTGKDFSSLKFISLATELGKDGKPSKVKLDFSHANGGVQEFIPPTGWPAGNRYKRVLYAMNDEAPINGYSTQLSIHQHQKTTPYQMGTTFFYCKIDGELPRIFRRVFALSQATMADSSSCS